MEAEARRSGEELRAIDLLENPDFLLHGIDFRRRTCSFLEVGPETYELSSFLDDRIERAGRRLHGVEFVALARLTHSVPAPDAAPHFIAHTSFCGSTLLARSLTFDRRSLVLREPQVLLLLAMAFREHPDLFTRRTRLAYLKLVLRYLNKSYVPSQRVLIKPSNLANRLLPVWLDAVPGTRGVFLTCGLEDFLLSVQRKTRETRLKMPRVARSLAFDSGYAARFPELADPGDDPLRAAAIAWHAQRYMLGDLVSAHPDRLLLLHQRDLLERPVTTVAAACRHLELEVPVEAVRARVHGRLWHRHAKDPRYAYSPERRRKDYQRARRKHARPIGRVMDWIGPYLHTLPGTVSLSGPGGETAIESRTRTESGIGNHA